MNNRFCFYRVWTTNSFTILKKICSALNLHCLTYELTSKIVKWTSRALWKGISCKCVSHNSLYIFHNQHLRKYIRGIINKIMVKIILGTIVCCMSQFSKENSSPLFITHNKKIYISIFLNLPIYFISLPISSASSVSASSSSSASSRGYA